jgi:hypothetical protein
VYGLVAGGRRKAGKSTEPAGLCVYSDWKSLIGKTRSPPSSPTRSRVMRYAAAQKLVSEPLDQFVQRKGGINECAARFTRWMGRGAVTLKRQTRDA